MAKPSTLKDHFREGRIFNQRSLIAFAFVICLTMILIARMIFLQVAEYDKYSAQSDENRVSVEPIAPTRGLIFDRSGTLLADNQPTYSVSLLKERVPDIDETIAKIGQIIELKDTDPERFKKRLKQRRRPFTPVALRYRLSEEEIAKIAVHLHRLPGVEIEANLVRNYPHKQMLAHTTGYVGRINEAELKKVDGNNYSATEHIGKTGIEKFYEDTLHGMVGYQTIETDARGRITNILERTDPVPGSNLHLYLDLPTQKASIEALGERRGAVVAIDPETGGVLAFASMPAFDPNLFVTGIDFKTYNALNTSKARPLFNRAIQGQYPPGSTVKPMIGLGGIETKVTTWEYTIYDPGWYKLENDSRFYRDWKKYGHGMVNLEKAVMQSCDTYFYEMAYNMGVDSIHDFMKPFGFGEKTGLDIVSERSGLLPSRAWKRTAKNQPWYPGETLITGIGQGYMLSTPLQLAVATAIVANRGKIIKPKMVEYIDAGNAKLPVPNKTDHGAIELEDPENWDKMIEAMRKVVHHPRGTATKMLKDLKGYDIAGKTGTAQVLGIAQDEEYDEEKISEWHRDHALFVGFAPVVNPKIAVAAIIENGGSGGSTASPVVRKVMDAYLVPRLTNPLVGDTGNLSVGDAP
ncbi:MAG: penicillin-binding protein 2 [Pseudomonadales bacterium]|nr:penicillin-binding protein 2 [Pseudomonadales bacterium]